jgi:hypothetical protein
MAKMLLISWALPIMQSFRAVNAGEGEDPPYNCDSLMLF